MYYIYIIDVHINWIDFVPVLFAFLMLLVIYFIAYILNIKIFLIC